MKTLPRNWAQKCGKLFVIRKVSTKIQAFEGKFMIAKPFLARRGQVFAEIDCRSPAAATGAALAELRSAGRR